MTTNPQSTDSARIAELEQKLNQQAAELESLRAQHAELMSMLDNVPGIVYRYIIEPSGRAYMLYINRASEAVLGIKPEELRTNIAAITERVHPSDLEEYNQSVMQSVQTMSTWRAQTRFLLPNGVTKWLQGAATPTLLPDGSSRWDGVLVDVTERKETEEMLLRAKRQEDLIRIQAESLSQISTPLIPISDDVMVMPLVGHIDAGRAERVLETLLRGIESHRTGTVILDITGVTVVDSNVAGALVRAAKAVRLLGTEVLLTGIRADVAQTMIGLGLDLGQIVTKRSLQAGVAHALKSRKV